MKIQVDVARRQACMRAHTATHLLHLILQSYFPMTKQSGSRVGEDMLRFDFSADAMLSPQQIKEISLRVNEYIKSDYPVSVQEMAYDSAIAYGAKAFFADKYGDRVRVVTIGSDDLPKSIELCGGTHVDSTTMIGGCMIIEQEAVASGIKRLVAITGPKLVEYIYQQQDLLTQIQDSLGVKSSSQLSTKLDKVLQEYTTMQQSLQSLQSSYCLMIFASKKFPSITNISTVINIDLFSTTNSSLIFKDWVQSAKSYFTDINVLLFDGQGAFALIAHAPGSDAKKIAQELGLRGGGNNTLVQGKDTNVTKII